MLAITDTKMLCRDQFCVGTTGPCRPKVPTFGCRANMSPTCWRHVGPTAKYWHFWPTRPCRADTKLIPTQHCCVGDGRHLPLSSFCTRVCMYAQPAKNLYIQRSLSCLQYTIEQLLTTTTDNNQHEPRCPTLHRL